LKERRKGTTVASRREEIKERAKHNALECERRKGTVTDVKRKHSSYREPRHNAFITTFSTE